MNFNIKHKHASINNRCSRFLGGECVKQFKDKGYQILKIDESLAIGWQLQFSDSRIARGIANHIVKAEKL